MVSRQVRLPVVHLPTVHSALSTSLLPDATGMFRIHRLALLAAKSLAEFLEVLHRAVGSPAARRVRICDRKLPRRLVGLILAPDLAKAQEVALRLGIAVDL